LSSFDVDSIKLLKILDGRPLTKEESIQGVRPFQIVLGTVIWTAEIDQGPTAMMRNAKNGRWKKVSSSTIHM